MFKKGENRNPRGAGAEGAKLSRAMMTRFRADFAKHGIAAIEKLRKEDVGAYLRLGVSLLPKNIQLDVHHDFAAVLSEASKQLAAERQGQALEHLKGHLIDMDPITEEERTSH